MVEARHPFRGVESRTVEVVKEENPAGGSPILNTDGGQDQGKETGHQSPQHDPIISPANGRAHLMTLAIKPAPLWAGSYTPLADRQPVVKT